LHVQRVRLVLQESIDKLFDRFDVISAPGEDDTADELQPPNGATQSDDGEPIDSLQPDAISSLCGLPAIMVPCGFDKNRMPVGIQFMARARNDQAVLSAANQSANDRLSKPKAKQRRPTLYLGRPGQWHNGKSDTCQHHVVMLSLVSGPGYVAESARPYVR